MFYNNLIHNNKFFSLIENYYKKDKIPHSILLYGKKGIGKQGHAIELASSLNCTNRSNYLSCGRCHSCIQLKSMQHPNIHFIIPFPRKKILSKKDQPEKALSTKDIDELIKIKKAKIIDPYSDFNLQNANTILINSIRFLKKELYNTSIEKGWKIILIFEAEKLCIPGPESANSLLKILEEPPAKTIFILVTNEYNKILKTIKSRCQNFYFNKLSFQKIRTHLDSKMINDNDLKLLNKIFDGDFNLIKKNLKKINDFNKKINKLFDYILNCNSTSQNHIYFDKLNIDKLNWFDYMKLFIIVLRDLQILKSSSTIKNLHLKKNIETYNKILKRYPNAVWSNCISSIEKTNMIIKQNVYFPLALKTLSIEIKNNLLNQTQKSFI